VLKTLGFQDMSVLGIVLAESTFVMFLGGGFGLIVAWIIVNVLGSVPLPGFYLDAAALTQGVVYILLAGLAAGIFPALQAKRLTIIDALSRV
jgi:putative ABC transport system permease protein